MHVAIILESGLLDTKQLTSNSKAEFDLNGITRATRVPGFAFLPDPPSEAPHQGKASDEKGRKGGRGGKGRKEHCEWL